MVKDLNKILLEGADVYNTPLGVLGECVNKDAIIGNPPYKTEL